MPVRRTGNAPRLGRDLVSCIGPSGAGAKAQQVRTTEGVADHLRELPDLDGLSHSEVHVAFKTAIGNCDQAARDVPGVHIVSTLGTSRQFRGLSIDELSNDVRHEAIGLFEPAENEEDSGDGHSERWEIVANGKRPKPSVELASTVDRVRVRLFLFGQQPSPWAVLDTATRNNRAPPTSRRKALDQVFGYLNPVVVRGVGVAVGGLTVEPRKMEQLIGCQLFHQFVHCGTVVEIDLMSSDRSWVDTLEDRVRLAGENVKFTHHSAAGWWKSFERAGDGSDQVPAQEARRSRDDCHKPRHVVA